MAIRKRENKVSNVKKVDDSKSSTFEHNDENNIGDKILKTFKEEAILTLNILEASGIDIYDDNRTPGMYVKQRLKRYYGTGSDNAPKSLVNVLSGNNKISTEKEETNISDELRLKLMKASKK